MATRTHIQVLNKMFILVFLVVGRAGCDWVEISQNHYRKEPPRQVNIDFEETTKAITVYRNNTLQDKHWKKGVIDRVPSVANIRRVHVPSVKIPSMQIEQNIFNRHPSIHTNVPNGRHDSITPKTNIFSKYHEEDIPIDPTESIDTYNINGGNSEATTVHKTHITKTNKLNRTESINKAYITNVKKGNLNQNSESSVKSTNLMNTENKGTTERMVQIRYQDESKADFNYEGRTGVMNEQLLPEDSKLKDITKNVEKTESVIKKPEIYFKESNEMHTQFKNNLKIDKNKESTEFKRNEAETSNNSDGISNNSKGNTMNTMWKLIKVVTDSIYKSTRKSFKSKIDYLEGLKSNILSSIENQIEETWPDDKARSSRRARDTVGRGHVEFPSSESALMSISFLTFAVFLIKLVLQVIHTYKNKTMMVTPAVVTAVGRAAAAMKSKI